MPFKTFLELKKKQVLIREYEIIGADFQTHSLKETIHTERGNIEKRLRLENFHTIQIL